MTAPRDEKIDQIKTKLIDAVHTALSDASKPPSASTLNVALSLVRAHGFDTVFTPAERAARNNRLSELAEMLNNASIPPMPTFNDNDDEEDDK